MGRHSQGSHREIQNFVVDESVLMNFIDSDNGRNVNTMNADGRTMLLFVVGLSLEPCVKLMVEGLRWLISLLKGGAIRLCGLYSHGKHPSEVRSKLCRNSKIMDLVFRHSMQQKP
ncbi:hypothetical protein JHK84_043103 [Glycine max]|nr:hypothetical protein JHK87_042828 [Glycine soja]KAG4949665.1 hypothetical protein JHK86_042904 [Glycine max]KAG4957151.1 hypothetical protein JHK85_043531 [Glycine max]KAG5116990.1 hypothetical protein JHK84_043103 [Glycine max]